jgi:hypothetical protein
LATNNNYSQSHKRKGACLFCFSILILQLDTADSKTRQDRRREDHRRPQPQSHPSPSIGQRKEKNRKQSKAKQSKATQSKATQRKATQRKTKRKQLKKQNAKKIKTKTAFVDKITSNDGRWGRYYCSSFCAAQEMAVRRLQRTIL